MKYIKKQFRPFNETAGSFLSNEKTQYAFYCSARYLISIFYTFVIISSSFFHEILHKNFVKQHKAGPRYSFALHRSPAGLLPYLDFT